MNIYRIFGILSVILGPVMRMIYDMVNNYGVAIILFTILIRLVSFPLALYNQKSMAKQSVFMPMVQEIQKKYARDPQKQNEELQRLQSEYGYNPTGGCLPQLLNMLVLFGVIEVIYYPLQYILQIPTAALKAAASESLGISSYIYTTETKIIQAVQAGTALTGLSAEQIGAIKGFNMSFLGINLCENPTLALTPLLIFPLLSVLTMIFTNVVTMNATGQQLQGSMKYMPWMMSIFFAFICFQLPVAFSLYYAISNVLMLGQTMICKKIYNPDDFKKKYAEELAAKKKAMKARKTVEVTDKAGKKVTKEVSASEMDKMRIARARELDAIKYADERTEPLSVRAAKAAAPAEEPAEAAPAEEKSEN